MDQSPPQPNGLGPSLTTRRRSGVAHITGTVAPIAGIQQGKRDDENEMMETR